MNSNTTEPPQNFVKLCRFRRGGGGPRIGLVENDSTIADLSAFGIQSLGELLEGGDPREHSRALAGRPDCPRLALEQATLLPPLERQEVWAAGVTYWRSRKARMEESEFSATAYDRVYEAPRPELFFKSLPEKVAGPGETVGIRADARWSVPEPELALLLNRHGRVAGYTIGNDLSARDIEGENLLYLPQAKIYSRSCSLGPWVAVGVGEAEARTWDIQLEILRRGARVFYGETAISQVKRSFGELSEWLFRCQEFPHGAVLLTGTGIVPPDDFSLAAEDEVRITVPGLGCLANRVSLVAARNRAACAASPG